MVQQNDKLLLFSIKVYPKIIYFPDIKTILTMIFGFTSETEQKGMNVTIPASSQMSNASFPTVYPILYIS